MRTSMNTMIYDGLAKWRDRMASSTGPATLRARWMRRRPKVRRGERGFTLVEILVVITIIGLIMGILVGPKVIKMFKEAKSETAWMMAKDWPDFFPSRRDTYAWRVGVHRRDG